jgi:uncharacterized protein YgbK (DUF1537 family)
MSVALIVADDLTGCLDAGVGFLRENHTVMAARSPADLPECIGSGAPVISLSTNTRGGTEAAARAAVLSLAEMLGGREFAIVLKKVDSRLKGHPGAETRELARIAGRSRIVAAPALPLMGRIQFGGQLGGMGVEGTIDLADRLGPDVEAPDLRLPTDFEPLVADRSVRRETLWAGARELAFALANAELGGAPPPAPPIVGPLSMIVGSRDPITVAQVEQLSRDGARITSAPNGLLDDAAPAGDPFVLAMAPGDGPCSEERAGARFTDVAARLLRQTRPHTLLCAGGETAQSLLARLGVGSMRLLGEIAPGLPMCEISAPWGEVRLITKSGGFGGPHLLSELALRGGLAENTGST